MLPVDSFIAELDSTRHEPPLLELLESRVDRPGLGLPVAGEPLLEFPNYFVPVHRLLGQEQEQPKGDGSNLHASRCGRGHPLTLWRADSFRGYSPSYPSQASIRRPDGGINDRAGTTSVHALPRRA